MTFSFTVTLQQHSPLIHFQHDQHGACLRATELKPKLDKYIAKHHFGRDFEKYKSFLVGYKESDYQKLDTAEKKKFRNNYFALDYKIRISSPKVETGPIIHKLYFGNMGKNPAEMIKQTSITPELDIEVNFFSFKPEILNIIKNNIQTFFAQHNFGTRQNKGFGSFYISTRDIKNFIDIEKVLPVATEYLHINSNKDEEIFSTILYYYKRLKSGINEKFKVKQNQVSIYHKSYLLKYVEGNINCTWEKRWLKEIFFGLASNNTNKKFARAFLGLPDNFTFKETKETNNPSNKITIEDNYEIDVSNTQIARVQSPITFKIIKDFNINRTKVFILIDSQLVEKIKDEIVNKRILFEFLPNFRLKKGSYKKNGKIKYKSKLIPWKKGLPLNEQNTFDLKYKRIIKEAEEFEKKGDSTVKGQYKRYQDFQKNHYYNRTLSLPDNIINYYDLIESYNSKELENKFHEDLRDGKIMATIKTI